MLLRVTHATHEHSETINGGLTQTHAAPYGKSRTQKYVSRVFVF